MFPWDRGSRATNGVLMIGSILIRRERFASKPTVDDDDQGVLASEPVIDELAQDGGARCPVTLAVWLRRRAIKLGVVKHLDASQRSCVQEFIRPIVINSNAGDVVRAGLNRIVDRERSKDPAVFQRQVLRREEPNHCQTISTTLGQHWQMAVNLPSQRPSQVMAPVADRFLDSSLSTAYSASSSPFDIIISYRGRLASPATTSKPAQSSTRSSPEILKVTFPASGEP